MKSQLTPDQIVSAARGWLSTPYVHQESRKNHGCDCLGLVRGIWRELIGPEPIQTPHYSSDWGEVGERELLKNTVEQYFVRQDNSKPMRADLVLFRWNKTSIVKHLGIMTGSDHFIHAYEKAGVVESPLVRDWRNRIAGIFQFPGVTK